MGTLRNNGISQSLDSTFAGLYNPILTLLKNLKDSLALTCITRRASSTISLFLLSAAPIVSAAYSPLTSHTTQNKFIFKKSKSFSSLHASLDLRSDAIK